MPQESIKYKTGFIGLSISLTTIFFIIEKIFGVDLFDLNLYDKTFCITLDILFIHFFIYFWYGWF